MEPTATPTATTSAPADAAPSTVNDAAAALAFADSSLATPETPEPTPAAAVTPPVETPVVDPATPEVTDDPRSPFIPRARFDEVNTQKNEFEKALKAYDWAKDYQPDELQSVATWAHALKTTPVEAALHLLSTLEADPRHAPALRSHAARTLAASRKPVEPVVESEPTFLLESPDGRVHFDPEAFARWREWNNRSLTSNIRQEFQKELQPMQQVVKAHREATATATVASVLTDMRADADFKAHEKDVLAEMQADPWLWELADTDPARALKIAYGSVYRSKVVPAREAGLKSKAETEAVAHLQQRAVAASTNPAAASTSTPKNTLGDARAALEYAYAQGG